MEYSAVFFWFCGNMMMPFKIIEIVQLFSHLLAFTDIIYRKKLIQSSIMCMVDSALKYIFQHEAFNVSTYESKDKH